MPCSWNRVSGTPGQGCGPGIGPAPGLPSAAQEDRHKANPKRQWGRVLLWDPLPSLVFGQLPAPMVGKGMWFPQLSEEPSSLGAFGSGVQRPASGASQPGLQE